MWGGRPPASDWGGRESALGRRGDRSHSSVAEACSRAVWPRVVTTGKIHPIFTVQILALRKSFSYIQSSVSQALEALLLRMCRDDF